MSTEFWDVSGNLLENIFEPASGSNGVSDPAYKDSSGNPLVFCALSFGSQAEFTDYGRTGGVGDLNTLWAKKGSVPYLVNPSSLNNNNIFSPCESVTWADELYSAVTLYLYPNGTWQVIRTSTNYKTDNIPAYGSQYIYDYSNGLLMAQGNWAQNPAPGVGNQYSVNISSSNLVSGWKDYPVQPANASNVVYHPGSFRGNGTVLVNGPQGGGTGLSLASTVSVSLVFQVTGNGGNGSYEDNNAGLSWYNQANFAVTIYGTNNPSIQVTANLFWLNELRWQQVPGYTGSPPPAPSPGGGGGGGGGCVASTMYLQPDLLASEVSVGKFIDGVGYGPDRIVPRMVEALQYSLQPCLRMVTESDIEIIASESTPMTMKDGSLRMFPDMLNEFVLVDDYGDIRWEKVKILDPVGLMLVAKISMSNQNYFAGTHPHRRIGTHNLIAIK